MTVPEESHWRHWMPPPELVCPHEDCLGWKSEPNAADCGNHEERMT